MDAPVQIKLGKDAKLYRNTGSFGSPSWQECDLVQDVTLGITYTEAVVTYRGASDNEMILPVRRVISVDVMILHQTQDANYIALRAAAIAKTPMEFLIVDTTRTTQLAEGLRAICCIFEFTRAEPIDGNLTDKLVLKPTLATPAEQPSWYVAP